VSSVLPRFYPIFDRAGWLERALPLGVRMVQLRIKDLEGEALRGELRQGLALARRHGAILVVNDHWELALEEGAAWVHLGQGDLDGADLAALRRGGVRLGISTHDPAELERALACTPDYVALGPVYPTRLKAMPWAPQGLARLTEWKARIGDLPLCAIGGMTVERAGAALAAGADLVSVVTDITLHEDPEARIGAWLEHDR
jgi:thiamine-phosphate pyrophosphorylase